MPRIALIRHGPTEWNAERRLQGRTDTPLSAEGARDVDTWRLPSQLANFSWVTSPLSRARETARRLGAPDKTRRDPRWQEMSWGTWEGRTLAELRAEYGARMGQWESLGLDFKAPDGESPREVKARVSEAIKEIADTDTDTIVVTHKGVLRAMLSLATNWDFLGKPPAKIKNASVHIYQISDAYSLSFSDLNVSLVSHRESNLNTGVLE